jgi:hypothetical protein
MEEEIGINESIVIMSAVRYMLGRASYGVGAVCDYVKENKNRLTDSNKQVIIRDIREYIEENPDIPQKKDWLELLELI